MRAVGRVASSERLLQGQGLGEQPRHSRLHSAHGQKETCTCAFEFFLPKRLGWRPGKDTGRLRGHRAWQRGRKESHLELCSIRLLRCTAISLYISSGHLAFCGPLFHISLGVYKKASCKVSAGNGLLGYSPLQLFQVYTEPEATDLTLDTQGYPGISFCWGHQQVSPFLRE